MVRGRRSSVHGELASVHKVFLLEDEGTIGLGRRTLGHSAGGFGKNKKKNVELFGAQDAMRVGLRASLEVNRPLLHVSGREGDVKLIDTIDFVHKARI